MRNETNLGIFHRAFSSRIEVEAALEGALKPSSHDFKRLKEACLELEATIFELGQGNVEDQYRAYHTAIAIFLLLAEWKHAIRNAEPDAQRFLNSAKLKASEVDKSLSFAADERLDTFLFQVEGLKSVDELTAIQGQLKRWSLPLLLFANLRTQGFSGLRLPVSKESSEEPEKLETTVAFLKFDIDGEPAKHWNYLKPGTSYDLTI